MTDERRSLSFEIEVMGSPEEVWQAIATGPGISSWYVPHEVEERAGGAAVARFGAGPEMEMHGRVAAWEPPKRIVFDGGDADEGLAFEWLVEARHGGTCIVRLVNSGFAAGENWDDHYNGMAEGWLIFLLNLRLHLEYFGGQTATASLPMVMLPGDRDAIWRQVTDSLGAPRDAVVGQRVELAGDDLSLAGEVVEVTSHRLSLLVDEPAPGVAFVTAEGMGDQISVSIWSYLYGEVGAAAVERDGPRWQSWLEKVAPPGPE